MYCHAVNLGWMTIIKVLILVPLLSHDCTRMSPVNPDLHALTVCLNSWLSFTHTTASAIPQISVYLFFPFTAIYLSMHPSVHPSIPLFISSFSLCLVEKQIACILFLSLTLSLSLCRYTSVIKVE